MGTKSNMLHYVGVCVGGWWMGGWVDEWGHVKSLKNE